MRGRHLDPVRHEVLKECRARTGRRKMPNNVAGGIGALFHKTEDFVHLNDVPLHSGDFI